METMIIALSILIGLFFIGIELRKGLNVKRTSSDEKAKQRQKYKINGKTYTSVYEIAKEFNVSSYMIYKWLKNGNLEEKLNQNNNVDKKVDKKVDNNKTYVAREQDGKYRKGKPIKYNGRLYLNAQELADEIGVFYGTIYGWNKKGILKEKIAEYQKLGKCKKIN